MEQFGWNRRLERRNFAIVRKADAIDEGSLIVIVLEQRKDTRGYGSLVIYPLIGQGIYRSL